MTSSERLLHPDQPRWNYNIQQYKVSRDVFFERGLFSVLFLACGRPDITRRCLLSTLDALSKCPLEIEWIFMENGECNENYEFFQNDILLERKVVVRQKNFGINEALNQMWAVSRGEFCIVLENDWENRCPSFDFVSAASDIFSQKGDIGIIQLRAIWDPCENWGIRKPQYSPWSCSEPALNSANVKLWHETTNAGHRYMISTGFYGFNNNPTIIRKALYRECGPYPECEIQTDPRHGETLYQEEILKTGCAIAHIGKEVYYHAGQTTTKGV